MCVSSWCPIILSFDGLDNEELKVISNLTFVEACAIGAASVKDLENYVIKWDALSPIGVSLGDYLGLTTEESSRWLRDNNELPKIIEERLNR